MQAHRLYVGTIGEGIFRSTDGGQTFARSGDGIFVECHVRALAVHPGEPRIIYLGTEQGLYLSKDGAETWERVAAPLDGMQIWSLLLRPHDPGFIVAGTCPSRLFVSRDGGRAWTEPNVRMRQECPRIIYTRVTTLTADPTEPATIWAGVEIDGLYRSRDAGQSWQPVGRGLSSADIHALAMVVEDGRKRLVATTNNDVNVSTDDGATWTPCGLGPKMPWPYFRALTTLPGNPGVLLLGNGDAPPGRVGTMLRSTDAGRTWNRCALPVDANSTIWNFASHPADPQLVYASSVSGELYRSTDAGRTWEKLVREFGEIRALAWAP
jgi:photosystem II stability/assembly factor-like uncharacterized protein